MDKKWYARMNTVFGSFVKKKREGLGLPLRKVATELNLNTSMLSKIEKEERGLSADLIPKLAEVIDTNHKDI